VSKARSFTLLLDAYGLEPDIGIVRAGIERMLGFLEHIRRLTTDGSEWGVQITRRGVLDELAHTIKWVEEHASARVAALWYVVYLPLLLK